VDKISDQLRAEIVLSGQLASWIGDQIENANVPGTPRVRNAMALYHIAFSHHPAVLTLIDRSFKISALALLRPLFESYLRGVWVEVSAKDDELVSFLKGLSSPNFKTLEKAARQASKDESLAELAKMLWGRFSHFTHSGAGLINRNQNQEILGDATPDKDCMAAIFFCDAVVLLASIRVSKLLGKPEYEHEILKKFNERKSRYETYCTNAREPAEYKSLSS
jgi:hypothetical protein